MKGWFGWLGMAVLVLSMAAGCGSPDDGTMPTTVTNDSPQDQVGEVIVNVDLDNAKLEISEPIQPAFSGVVNGHTLEVVNGPAGCTWNSGTYVMTCEIQFRNLDSDQCMTNVRTRLFSSTNPAAIMDQVDYGWIVPGISYNLTPNTAQPINNSGYCITDDSPSSSGSAEGCANTWQANIPSGSIATQKFTFTNVTSGSYSFRLGIYSDYTTCSAPAGMKRIPAGCYTMGNATTAPPEHNVCITSDIMMDDHEVTNAEYRACVTAGKCTAPSNSSSATRATYYGNATYDNFPVMYVTYYKAAQYCSWKGKRMPTEAEWEYASRGGLNGKAYPWGDSVVGTNANYMTSGDIYDNDTTPFGYYLRNGFGLYDMSGNVLEWVYDYSAAYTVNPVNNPSGPYTGTNRSTRGGSWNSTNLNIRSFTRTSNVMATSANQLGFRCAQDELDETYIMNAVNCGGSNTQVAYYDFETFVPAEWSYWTLKGTQTSVMAHSGTKSILLTGPTYSEVYRAFPAAKTGKVAVSGWWYMPDGNSNHRLILSNPIAPWGVLRGAGAYYDSTFEDSLLGNQLGPLYAWEPTWGWHFILVILDFDKLTAEMYDGTGPGNIKRLIRNHTINASNINAIGLDAGYNYSLPYYADDLRVCALQ